MHDLVGDFLTEQPDGADGVEVASCPHTVHSRDSKDLAVPILAVSPASWTSFVELAAS
ncbi:DUF397 domain-containing protein [Streptomyces anulatus]|uniref:DUF397 domain-containing protein n=1 Tax=Streptomyces anulatus TaxID=1892 RepID=UPI002E302FBC|nr:DUF397 domain-containing protein [Streptomyces anulatus]